MPAVRPNSPWTDPGVIDEDVDAAEPVRVALVISSAAGSLVRSVWMVTSSAALPCSRALAASASRGSRSRSTPDPGAYR
jgi:hypothetical protein